jgi:hypothetical protein
MTAKLDSIIADVIQTTAAAPSHHGPHAVLQF